MVLPLCALRAKPTKKIKGALTGNKLHGLTMSRASCNVLRRWLNVARARYELVWDLRERPIEPFLCRMPISGSVAWSSTMYSRRFIKARNEWSYVIRLRRSTTSSTAVLIGHIIFCRWAPIGFYIESQFCHSPHRAQISPRCTRRNCCRITLNSPNCLWTVEKISF